MARKDEGKASAAQIAQIVRRHLRLSENGRFLRRMPQFALSDDMPSGFSELLAKIDTAQRRTR